MKEYPESMPPIIGLSTGGRIENDFASDYYDSFFYIPSLYIEAVRRAGGIPVLLPPDSSDGTTALLSRLDGLIITGGADIDPRHYNGNTQHPDLTKIDHERDNSEMALIRLCLETEKPMLCVCRGMQVLNVALAGTMHEHIPDVREKDIHRSADGLWAIHEVLVDENSLLAKVMGTNQVETYSGHHQAVKAIGQGLCVIAQAPDGIVEALTHEKHPWVLAVQWHPEKSAATDPSQQALFDALVQKAAQ
jgi:putative glutamine amidotransferase